MARPSAVPQITAPVRHAPVARFAPPPGSGEAPFFARIACARAPAFAPARPCAPDCPRASKRKAHVSCLFHWVFFAPAPGEAASGHRLLLIHATTEFPESSLSWKQNGIFPVSPRRLRGRRPGRRPVCGDGRPGPSALRPRLSTGPSIEPVIGVEELTEFDVGGFRQQRSVRPFGTKSQLSHANPRPVRIQVHANERKL